VCVIFFSFNLGAAVAIIVYKKICLCTLRRILYFVLSQNKKRAKFILVFHLKQSQDNYQEALNIMSKEIKETEAKNILNGQKRSRGKRVIQFEQTFVQLNETKLKSNIRYSPIS
jgi:hypothetical protein